MTPQLQAILVLCVITGFIVMELATRRYQATVTATTDDTRLELFMFLSLVASLPPIGLARYRCPGRLARAQLP